MQSFTIWSTLMSALLLQLNSAEPLRNGSLPSRHVVLENRPFPLKSEETVYVSIEAVVNQSFTTYSLRSPRDLNTLNRLVHQFRDTIVLRIDRKPDFRITLSLNRSSLILSKNFFHKHFSVTGGPVVEHLNAGDQRLPNCYFNGRVVGIERSHSTLNLCMGVKGVVEISGQTYELEPVFDDTNLSHKWVEQAVVNLPVDMQCGAKVSIDNLNSATYQRQNKFSKEYKSLVGQNSSTKHVEMYLVVDNSLYNRIGSVADAVLRAISIVNYASSLYRQQNLYIALVGMEIWNDADKIKYNVFKANPDEYDSFDILENFELYTYSNINPYNSNDVGHLLTARDLDGVTLGQAYVGTTCSHRQAVGITYDWNKQSYSSAATTMTHELGHNLGLSHSTSPTEYPGRNCDCVYSDNSQYNTCIMSGSVTCTCLYITFIYMSLEIYLI